MHAFVGADGYRARQGGEYLVAAGGQRLFDEADAVLGAGGEVGGNVGFRPSLIGVENDAAPRRAAPDGANARRVV